MEQVNLKTKRLLSLATMLLVFCLNMMAQGGVAVKGKVVTTSGEPVIGASVMVKGKPGV